jgi:hypothetical protein
MAQTFKAHWRASLVVAVAVVTAISLVATRSAFATSTRPAPTFSSTDIANAVVFNEGPAAAYVPTVGHANIQWTDQVRGVQAGLLNAIRTDPTGYYSTDFAKQMQSGDPQAVQLGLQNLGATVRTFLEQNYAVGQVDDMLRLLGINVGTNAVSQEDLDGPVLLVVIVVAVVFFFIGAAEPSPDQKLAFEKRTSQLAASLHTAK